MNSSNPWLSLVGLGEDGIDGLSGAARTAIGQAELIVGGRRHLDLIAGLARGRTLAWQSPIEATFPAILAERPSPVCVLASGDPFFYGIGATLTRVIPAGEMSSFPQPSAFSLAASRLGWALQDCRCLSLHGRPLARILRHLAPGVRILALSWDGETPRRLAEILVARGFGPSRLYVLEAMGGPREQRRTTTAAAFDWPRSADLNTIALEVEADLGAFIRPFTPGLRDDGFEHDGQITKAPIRALTLSALAPKPGQVLWDVGAGSGSVSIEWLLQDESLTAVAFEQDRARAERIERNAERWGVADRLEIRVGRAPECLPNSSFRTERSDDPESESSGTAGCAPSPGSASPPRNEGTGSPAADQAASVPRLPSASRGGWTGEAGTGGVDDCGFNPAHPADPLLEGEGRNCTVQGDTPAARSPHAIFIGGGVTVPGLIDRCRDALPKGGVLVANAVTLESQALLANTHAIEGGALHSIAIATSEPVGRFHGLRPAMTVMHWRWEKP